MRKRLHNLFFPSEHNNQRAKVLHHSFLTLFVLLVVIFQASLSFFTKSYPGVLGYATNISVEKLIELTNKKRAENGLSILKPNQNLNKAAQAKASHMFSLDYWAHFAPDGTSPWFFVRNYGYDYLYAGENLARDFPDSGGVVKAWMDSSTHRENILSARYTEIGIAVVDGILNGEETTLVVQMFGRPTKVAKITPESKKTIALGEQALPELNVSQLVKQNKTISIKRPNDKILVSSFILTKDFSIALLILLLLVLLIDSIFICRVEKIRIAGKSFIHFSFFAIILISILLSHQGAIY